MYKKLISGLFVTTFLLIAGAWAMQPGSESAATKTAQSEDEKYAEVYDECAREAEGTEAGEAGYDSIFNKCMEKNGFPQDVYETDQGAIGQGE